MADIFKCPQRSVPIYFVASYCGTDRDCISNRRLDGAGFTNILCNALAWNQLHPTRFVEIFTEDRSRRVAKVTQRWASAARVAACGGLLAPQRAPGGQAGPDPFTIDIPGLQDIIKVKDWESKDLRRERYERFKSARSAVPQSLQWIPPLLTKLDNAQDMLFTGLALAIPLIKRLPARLIPGIGLLLTINDIINLFT